MSDWVARVVFLIQILLIFGGRCNHYYWDIGLKMYRLLKFNMLFQFLLTEFSKSELVDHVTNYCKKAYCHLHLTYIHTCIHTNFIQDVNKLIYRKNTVLKDILKRELRL